MSQSDNKGERVATIPITPGIFVLRYFAARAATPPHLFVRASPASENSVALIFAPGAQTGVLAAPGSYALVVAERAGRIQLTIVGAPGEDDGAEVKIEPFGKLIEAATLSAGVDDRVAHVQEERIQETRPLDVVPARRWARAPASVSAASGLAATRAAGADQAAATRSGIIVARNETAKAAGAAPRGSEREGLAERPARLPETAASPELSASGFGFVCHVARKGDVGVAGGGWIGGPGSPAVIEGVTLHWHAPGGLQLEYQVLVSGAAGRWSAWVSDGAFAGTRGRGLPIVGLRVRIAGASAGRFRLQGEAIFLGLPAVADSGESLEFSSYAGVDPLVGLRLNLTPAETISEAPGPDEKKPGIGRLRVFKSMRAEERAF